MRPMVRAPIRKMRPTRRLAPLRYLRKPERTSGLFKVGGVSPPDALKDPRRGGLALSHNGLSMNTQFSLQNRTAIVTGAGQGMGRDCARAPGCPRRQSGHQRRRPDDLVRSVFFVEIAIVVFNIGFSPQVATVSAKVASFGFEQICEIGHTIADLSDELLDCIIVI